MPGGEHLHLPAEVVVPSLPGLSLDYLRARIRTKCLDLIIGGSRQPTVTAKINLYEPAPLERIVELVTLQAAPGEEIEAQLFLDNERLDIGKLTLDAPALRGDWASLSVAVATLKAVCHVAMAQHVQLTFAEVLDAGRDLLSLMSLAGDCAARIEFDNLNDNPEILTGLLAYLQISIGKFSLGALVERGIKDDVVKNATRCVVLDQPKVIDAFVDT